MALSVDPCCMICNREIAKDSKILYVVKGYVATKYLHWNTKKRTATVGRYGGKVEPRGIVCFECAEHLPEPLHFKE